MANDDMPMKPVKTINLTRRGRPRKQNEEKKDHHVNVSLSAIEYSILNKFAEMRKMTMSSLMRLFLRQAIRKRGMEKYLDD